MPEAEREEWRQLWADVKALLQKVQSNDSPRGGK